MNATSKFVSDYTSQPTPVADIQPGMAVPPLDRCVSRVQSTLYTAAIRFAHQVHFDDEMCRAQGWKGVILPGFLLGNWCMEAVTRMLGPQSVVRSVSFRLTSVAYPDAMHHITGEVSKVEQDGDWTLVTCTMAVNDPDETLVTKATVTVAVPTTE